MVYRSNCLVPLGWLSAVVLYFLQAGFLLKFSEQESKFWWFAMIGYFAFAVLVFIILCAFSGYAESNAGFLCVLLMWLIYIILHAINVGLVFGIVGDELKTSDTFGPNFLKSILCITPALLVLVLHLTISPSYRKGVLSLSIVAALNLFDGIEMLEIVLMQKERENFELDKDVEMSIILLACMSFVVTSLGLARFKLEGNETVEERDNSVAVCFGLIEVFLTNLPFLILRIFVWVDNGYEASIFIAKNIISLVIGFVDFFIACKCCKCE